MMISPESYYEENLKNKSADEIITKIRGLKKQIGHLKNKMEHPEYRYADMIDPSEPVQLHWTKEYLARAIQALEDAGGTYIPSKAEKNAAAFDENIPHISKIIFSIGGFFTGNNEYVISITDPIIATKKTMWSDEMPYFLVDEFEEPQ